jgi:hypothetical protein
MDRAQQIERGAARTGVTDPREIQIEVDARQSLNTFSAFV